MPGGPAAALFEIFQQLLKLVGFREFEFPQFHLHPLHLPGWIRVQLAAFEDVPQCGQCLVKL